MNILIVGGNGFLGSSCANKLAENNTVYIIDNGTPRECLSSKICYFRNNLTNLEEIIKIIELYKIEIIIHFVSSLLPSSTEEDYLLDISNVYLPTVKLLSFCSKKNVKFVYISSGGAVYGNQHEVFNENTKCEPVSYYGLSKLNFENAIKYFHNLANLDYLIIRPSNPYGPGQNLNGSQGVIAVLMGKILKQEPFQIWGDGTAIKDYIYIDDFVKYLEKLIYSNNWNHIYNVGTGIGYSVNDVIEVFLKNKIELPKIEYISAKRTDVKRMVLDCSKIQEAFPSKNITLEDGIQRFYNFVKE